MENINQRRFPEPTRDALKAFIYHTNRIERIPMNLKTIEDAETGKEPNPFVEGHLRAINKVLQIAPNPNLLPTQIKSVFEFDEKMPWIKQLHKNIMKPIAEYGEMMLDTSYIKITDVGSYRQSNKYIKTEKDGKLVDIEMPDPLYIREHLKNWANDLCQFHNDMKHTIEYGRYSEEETQTLVNKAYEANIKLCCIKPFIDGSNRLGRLVENAFRLNWGLPWKIITIDDKENLLDDLRDMQTRF